jgi:serine/tyrosine/threonine adenylyltransferase
LLDDSNISVDLPRAGWNFENTYSRLPPALFEATHPAAFPAPRTVILNHDLAEQLGLSLRELSDQDAAAVFSGQAIPPGAKPIAQAYAGHQFGGFTMLGDGRALLLGEQRTPAGQLFDIQFKGSGQTPFSRSGDGLAALGPMLREYIISEAMHALGIPTARSLAIVTTGQPVYRERVLQGAVLTRVAASHVRVGTFQYLAARQDASDLQALADYSIARHFPELSDGPDKYLQLLKMVIDHQASLIAKWQLVGFIHGVMNTDNMAISGETIDYGPCAFMDRYHPQTVFSSIDHGGRYAYGNQPAIGQWNLARFAETLLPLLDSDQDRAIALATGTLNDYLDTFEHYWLDGMRKKVGLRTQQAEDRQLIEDLLEWMQHAEADFTNTFDDLSADGGLSAEGYHAEDFRSWHARWQGRLKHEGTSSESARQLMQSVNPAVIARNERVEEALSAATDDDDFGPFQRLLKVLSRPYDRRQVPAEYRQPPPAEFRYRTFCGT